MAKRKLHGAALAAYNRKRGIGSGKARSTKALARRGPQTIVIRQTGGAVAKKKRRGGKRRGGGARRGIFSGLLASLKAQAWDLGASAGYGFVTQAASPHAVMARGLLNKLPEIPVVQAAVGKPFAHGLWFYLAAHFSSGTIRKVADHTAHAAFMRSAYNIGASGLDLDAAAKLAGEDDYDLSGEMDDDDDLEGDYYDDELEGDDDVDDEPDDVDADDDDDSGAEDPGDE